MSASVRDLTGLETPSCREAMSRVYDWLEHDLTDKERDTVIQHPDPTFDCGWWQGPGCGCLVGCVLSHRTGGVFYTPSMIPTISEASDGFWHTEVIYAFPTGKARSRATIVGTDAANLAIHYLDPEEFWRRVKRFAAHVSGVAAPVAVSAPADAPEPVAAGRAP